MNNKLFVRCMVLACAVTSLSGCMVSRPGSREIAPKHSPSRTSGSSTERPKERGLLPPNVAATVQGKDVYVEVVGRERHGVGVITLAIRQAGGRVVNDTAAELRFRIEIEAGPTSTSSISGYPSTEHRFAAHVFVEGREVQGVGGVGRVIYVQLFQGAAEYARRLSKLGTLNMGQREAGQIVEGVVRDALKFLK